MCNAQLRAEMCSWSVQGLILKCVFVGSRLFNVVWHETFLYVGLVRLALPETLVFCFSCCERSELLSSGLAETVEGFFLNFISFD